ncbi:hypothetical protein JR338_12770 (plasmid) [Chloroflexota bacterium]|nr:hypothetical protein JR338_12770 [Chloroflexota bacterium]
MVKDEIENLEKKDQSATMPTQKGGGEEQKVPSKKATKVHIATFRGIPLKLHESLKSIAADLGIAPGELARYFLENGLARIGTGKEEVAPSFVPGGYTLYPDEKQNASRTRRKRSKKSQQPRSYYGVPREVVQAVLEKSQAMGVTQGELARHLFERGVARFKAGDLVLDPVPVQQIATLYPEDMGKV